MWFLRTVEAQNLIKEGAEIVYVTIDNNELPEYASRIIQLAGLDFNRFRRISVPEKFETVYVPDNSIVLTKQGRIYTKEYIEIIQSIQRSIDSFELNIPKYEKIYFSRTLLPLGRDYGEKHLEVVFASNGYKIIYPEQEDILNQIFWLMHCSWFASTEGSISHNIIFCNPNTNVVILRKGDYVNSYQMMINHAVNANMIIIDAFVPTFFACNPKWLGPFYLCVTTYVRDFFKGECRLTLYILDKDYWSYLDKVINKYFTWQIHRITRKFRHIWRRS